MIDTRKYSVEFDDEEVSELTENLIAESLYAAWDDSGNEYPMMESIVDYQKSKKALSVAIQKVVQIGQSFMWGSTVGWQICIQWIYGSTSWKYLKELKESHTLDTA